MAIGFPLVILGSVLATAHTRARRPAGETTLASGSADESLTGEPGFRSTERPL